MKVLLYIKDADDNFIHITTAKNEQALDELLHYARYKIRNGSDVKIEHEQVQE